MRFRRQGQVVVHQQEGVLLVASFPSLGTWTACAAGSLTLPFTRTALLLPLKRATKVASGVVVVVAQRWRQERRLLFVPERSHSRQAAQQDGQRALVATAGTNPTKPFTQPTWRSWPRTLGCLLRCTCMGVRAFPEWGGGRPLKEGRMLWKSYSLRFLGWTRLRIRTIIRRRKEALQQLLRLETAGSVALVGERRTRTATTPSSCVLCSPHPLP
mmetsp:Transcript_28983/g.58264  ORF Transcript_28983/g.58264 Transcript_28983/m.58264 type:complete len:214 (-) Transcript_28983:312-953(-)